MTKGSLGTKGFMAYTSLYHLKKLGQDLQAGTEAEAMKRYFMLNVLSYIPGTTCPGAGPSHIIKKKSPAFV